MTNLRTTKLFLKVTSILLIVASSINSLADTTLIYVGELLAIPGEQPTKERTVVVEDGVIKAINKGYSDTSNYGESVKTIDLKDSFVLPGLMDMHVHLQFELGPHNVQDGLKMSEQLQGMRSIFYGQKTLLAGFTTVRDVGSDPQYMYALRDAISKGWVDGPRIIAAGGVGITGGHADVSGVKPDLLDMYTAKTICDGPYDCRRATRRAIKFGADLIKITSTGGVLSDRATGTGQQMEMDELKEVVRAAKSMGRKIASHAHEEAGIIAALKAGVDSIEHGTYTGPKAIKLFKKTGAYLVPTLLAGDTVVHMANNSNFMSDAIKEKAIRVGSDMKGNFAKAYKAGVKVAFGTDSGVSKHGTNAQEAVLMFNAGMSAMEVIKSATVNAADLLDMTETIGTIEVGKYADIIATDASPLEDIKELLTVDFVMKNGKVHKQ
ncbi:MAG: amidohydrolase family protein [Gammaproteobacteria bacterium]|nr:amidohydrolase family protein [Gammaproteobacteria bacterium]